MTADAPIEPANDTGDDLVPAWVIRFPTDPEGMVRQLWRWAAGACPDGIPPGFTEEDRPR